MSHTHVFRQYPETSIEGCTLCVGQSHIYSAECLGCRVRQTSRLPKFARMKTYIAVKDARGIEFAKQFVAEVNYLRAQGTA